MKNNYDKYISEVFEMKDNVFSDFKNSGCKSYTEYIEKEMKSLKMKPAYHFQEENKRTAKIDLAATK
jgi:hypothetical protein